MFRSAAAKSLIVCLILGVIVRPAWAADSKRKIVRIGHFPNLTHAQGLVAHQLSRQGKGWFESRLGPDYQVQWLTYNAGPSAMEALFTDALDFTYVGPNPALNAFVKSKGRVVRVVAGAAAGGAALTVRKGLTLTQPGDFRGKKIATPQLGNTQDISARAWLTAAGLKITQQGGDAFIIPTANADQLDLMRRGEIDAAWTVEPWCSRLELETEAHVVLEDKSSLSTVLAASAQVAVQNSQLVKTIVQAHRELTDWINANPVEAKKLLQAELKEETGKSIDPQLLGRAWARITFAHKLDQAAFAKATSDAITTGFLPADFDFSTLLSTQW